MGVEREGDRPVEGVVPILATLSELIERLRRVAAELQGGRADAARTELQGVAAELEELIGMLAAGEAAPSLGREAKEELIAELRLVQEDIAAVGLSAPRS